MSNLNDFSALKSLKKELEKQEKGQEPPVASQARKSKTIKHRSLEEEHARNIGIEKGARVRMMDTSDSGTVVGFGKGFYEIDIEGLVIRAERHEFILADEAEDKMMLASMPPRPKKHQPSRPLSSPSGELVIDLHFDRIPGNENVPEWAALDYQLNWFRKILRENLKHRGKRIVFIHGDGDGILKAAVRKELDEIFPVTCTYTFGVAEQYGTGATIVTVR